MAHALPSSIRRADEVALVLAVLVVEDDDELTGGDIARASSMDAKPGVGSSGSRSSTSASGCTRGWRRKRRALGSSRRHDAGGDCAHGRQRGGRARGGRPSRARGRGRGARAGAHDRPDRGAEREGDHARFRLGTCEHVRAI